MPEKPVVLPKLGARTADTHAHLDMLDDPAGALERASLAGVMFICTVADATEHGRGTFESLQSWLDEAEQRMTDWGLPHPEAPEVVIVLGVHPHNAKAWNDEVEAELRELARDPRVRALGEMGLDYHYDHSPRELQRDVFRRQLEIAHELDLPAVLHLREAHEDGLAILSDVGLPPAGCIIHCFTEGPETAARFLEIGCHLSFAGPVTFSRGQDIRDAAATVPLDRLLVETDCPFMAPAPHRGHANEPAFAVLNVAKIADVKGVEPKEVALQVLENARRLFRRGEAS